MVMKKCKECGNDVSTKAESCPKCGAVLKKKTGCLGYIVGGISILIILGVIGSLKSDCSNKPIPKATPPKPAKPAETTPKIKADLTKFFVDRSNAQFVFVLKISNQESQENTVYAVVYGKNDSYSPPRRGAWLFGGLLFHQAGTRRGSLSSSDISRNWDSRPENTKGMKIVLKPNGSKSLEGALPITEISLHEAWRGKPLDPRSMYDEVYLWVFSQNGKLIFEKKYEVEISS
jgi:hypothetical protein